ncbi:YlxR family protein [Agrococcus beijingensis]|uniref:YlxR family protein n=1 Tax=Agrococcus beijingensis TaxID=3068634 RepID=UPI003BEECEC6
MRKRPGGALPSDEIDIQPDSVRLTGPHRHASASRACLRYCRRIRTCLGCRARTEPAHLVRIVAQDSVAVVDLDQRLPGRGAWVHPTQQCVERAVRSLPRALRQKPLDTSPIARWAQDGLEPSPDRRNETHMDN